MNKTITLITCLIWILFRNAVFAQNELKTAEDKDSKKDTKTYNIQSLDGKNRKIRVIHKFMDHVLRIAYLKDTITDSDFWGPIEIRILNKQFLEIKYAVRGGSGVGLGNIMFLCVKENKLYEALHVLNYSNCENGGEDDDYHIKVVLKGKNKKTYKLNINIHDKIDSKSNPAINYNYNNQTVLNFDTSRNVFYNIKQDLYDLFVLNSKTGKKPRQEVRGNFPVIILGKKTYYFINRRWYELENAKALDEV